ncbi:hypothetical protein ACQ856_17320 [Mycolicibacterium psychrotolerans]|uniref:hypothetical protein n=1 Tax=Mycolicibacterium psychrotolerans TaxID=216929 RepID=UPI003D66E161
MSRTLTALLPTPQAAATPAPSTTAHAHPVQEDDLGWSCVDDGNRICGPGNPEGKPAACYDDGGVIVALWPCHVVVNSDGSGDVHEGP